MRHLLTHGLLLGLLLTACAHPPYVEPFAPKITRPGPGEAVLVTTSILIIDASGSIDMNEVFPYEKALIESFVAGMPPGAYQAGLYVLGGRPKDQLSLRPLDRWHLQQKANTLRYVGRETPLAAQLESLPEVLADSKGRAALIILSDGVPTHYERYVGPEDTLAAAKNVLANRQDDVCFHTIWLGDDTRGPELLRPMAELSDCGSYRTLASLDNREALAAYQREIYLGPAPPPKAKKKRAMTDLDQDGVDDRFDRCPKTPFDARVDVRGCWVIEDYVFETDSALISTQHRSALDAVVVVLSSNPPLRVRLDGHTDDQGAATYNFDLAEQRAEAVRQYLVAHGIDAARLETRGFGPSRPIAPNETPEGRRKNRRVELSIIDW